MVTYRSSTAADDLKTWNLTTPRNPSPADDRIPTSIGDVGFIRDGRFNLLFSAGSPLEEPEPGEVPATFVPLDVGSPVSGKPRQPGCLHTPNVRPLGPPSGTETFTPLYVPSLEQYPHRFQIFSPRLPEDEANFAFELTGDRGAALVTRHRTVPEDMSAKSETAFEMYIKVHYKSWVNFANSKRRGNDIHLVLVSGFDMTRDFSTVAYSREGDALTSPSTTPTQMFTSSTPPDFRGEWRALFPLKVNNGPRLPSPRPGRAGNYSYRPSQCVFIRYYTMRSRKWDQMGSKPTRVGAGPARAGSGSNIDQNTPHVRSLLSLPVSPLNLSPGGLWQLGCHCRLYIPGNFHPCGVAAPLNHLNRTTPMPNVH